jgi:hypothetical protein
MWITLQVSPDPEAIAQFDIPVSVCQTEYMKDPTIPERMETLEGQMATLIGRMDSHSQYIVTTLLPQLDALERKLTKVWVSDERFTELGDAVADIAAMVYKIKNDKGLSH